MGVPVQSMTSQMVLTRAATRVRVMIRGTLMPGANDRDASGLAQRQPAGTLGRTGASKS